MNLQEIFQTVQTVLVIDWPDKEVPGSLAFAGFKVVVRGGPRPEDHSAWDVSNGEIAIRPLGRPPERADLIYSYRPLSELPGIVAIASKLNTKALWVQSGLAASGVKDPKGCWISEEQLQLAQNAAEPLSLTLITEPYIVDAVREFVLSGPERG